MAIKKTALVEVDQKRPLTADSFAHLHNHSHYSLLDGLSKVPAMIQRAKDDGMTAMAITDHGTLSGLLEFYVSANNAGIKPVLGMEAYVSSRKHTDKDPGKDKLYYHLIILAMNNEGYQNLLELSTIAQLQGFYYKPRIDHDLLEKYNKGLIILSGCIGGEIGDALRQNQLDQAGEIAEWYKSVFGDRYYLEIQDHGHLQHPSRWDEQTIVNERVLNLAKSLNIPAVVTCDAHYVDLSDREAHEVLLCVQTGSFLTDESRMSLKKFELHITSPRDIIKRWGREYPEVIANTKIIAERCNVTIELGKYLIPKFPVPNGETEKSFLDKLTYAGLVMRYSHKTAADIIGLSVQKLKKLLDSEIIDRAEYELGVINSMGFNGYFLIVQDFINWGKDQGIIFGPGRGSGAGSIVAYGLRITEIDPLLYDLLFERFLNPDRISMPDFDIDIQDTRRDEVIQYCVEKYGKDRVANIVTFGKMAARNAVRDVARVLQVPYAEADRLAKMIPPPIQGRHILLSTSIVENQELKREYDSSEQTKRIFDLAIKLEGTIRSHGVHAAGVVIAPDDIVKFTPLEMAQKGVVATQYSMGPIEDLGLLKMDFLGLSNLTIIKNALRIIKKVYKVDVDINTIPLDDTYTYEMLARGDTTGVFQLESAGMKRYLKELKPNVFEDIISMVALYRPGPMQWIEDFIARKHGLRKIEYLHPAMEPALKNTYGIIVTQEQVMQISKEMCGFTGGQADTLRKAIGKKNPEVMKKMRTEFIEGAIKTVGADRQLMIKFWKQLLDFAAYCFNKAHSTCYAMIAYQTAYLKAHYPAAFMAAIMTSDYDDIDRLAIEISECQKMGIKVLAPDVNESFVEFAVAPDSTPTDGPIRFGMNAIKNVGTAAVEEILRAREINGSFQSLESFFANVNLRIVNRKALESLIKAGAFDRFNERQVILGNIDVLMAYGGRVQKDAASGQTDLFGKLINDNERVKPQLVLEKVTAVTPREVLLWERELLGIYLSQHPLVMFKEYLSELAMPIRELKAEMDGRLAVIGGVINTVREIVTKNGQKMAFVKIEDLSGDIEIILFPSAYQQTLGLWERDKVVLVRGKVNGHDRQTNEIMSEVKLLADEAREITAEQAEAYQSTGRKQKLPKVFKTKARSKSVVNSGLNNPKIYIRFENSDDQSTLMALKNLIDSHQGSSDVVLVLGQTKRQIVKLPDGMSNTDVAISSLRQLFGSEQVIVR